MAWDRIKRMLRRRAEDEGASGAASPQWIEAVDNPWRVRVLDVRPVTLTMVSTSADPQCASNVVSFGQDDGTSFIGQDPSTPRVTEVSLRFPVERALADGVLFIPRQMEHKWAIFHHRGEIICVRSWRRNVQVTARIEQRDAYVQITRVRGTFGAEDESPEFTTRALDFLLRSHALDTVYPAPLPIDMASRPSDAALWCMSMFGNRVSFATPHSFPRLEPERPLRIRPAQVV
jgi:hypothetical protein